MPRRNAGEMRRVVIRLEHGDYVIELVVARLGQTDRIVHRAVFPDLRTARDLAKGWSRMNTNCPIEDLTE